MSLIIRVALIVISFVAGGIIDLLLIYFANNKLSLVFKDHAYSAYQVLVLIGYAPFLIVFFLSLTPLSITKIYMPRSSWIIAYALIAVGLILNYIGVRDLGSQRWNSKQQFDRLPKKNILITTGVYSKIRHPTYLGQILVIYGLAILFPSIPILLASVMFHIYLVLIHSRVEERQLEKAYGKEFIEHKKKTGAFLPRIRVTQ